MQVAMIKLSDFLRVVPAGELLRSHCKTCGTYIGTGVTTEVCIHHTERAEPEVADSVDDDKPKPRPRHRHRLKVSDEEFARRLEAIRSRQR